MGILGPDPGGGLVIEGIKDHAESYSPIVSADVGNCASGIQVSNIFWGGFQTLNCCAPTLESDGRAPSKHASTSGPEFIQAQFIQGFAVKTKLMVKHRFFEWIASGLEFIQSLCQGFSSKAA